MFKLRNPKLRKTDNQERLTGSVVSLWSKLLDSSTFGELVWKFGLGFACK